MLLWVLTEEEGLAAIGFLIFCMGLGQVLIAYTTTPHKKKKDDPFPQMCIRDRIKISLGTISCVSEAFTL